MPLVRIDLPSGGLASDLLFEFLRNAILEGDLLPNERLVEKTIAELASVSRTPVREALGRLLGTGLVSNSTQGLVVRGPSLDEIADLYEVYQALEILAIRKAAFNRTELEIMTLRKFVEEEAEALQNEDVSSDVSLRAAIVRNRRFHSTLWQASRNRYLASQITAIHYLIEGLQRSTLSVQGRREEALHDHLATLEAIERLDADAAATVFEFHLRGAMALRLSRLP